VLGIVMGGQLAQLDKPPLYCQCRYMSTVKDDRLQIRVDPEAKRLLEQAAASTRLSVSAFVLRAASQEAESVLAERPLIALDAEAAEVFRTALDRPGRMNKRLAAALGQRGKLRWID
jgi:uncharacterized protein (DUF1778 family)